MNTNQKILIDFLSILIHQQKSHKINLESIDWYAIHEEAFSHQIHAMLYPLFVEPESQYILDSKLLSLWQRETFFIANKQIQHIQQICTVLETFFQLEIPVIALKGLILRDLYPQPFLRTMGDADILIHIEDLDRVKSLLFKFGYFEGCTTLRHVSFYHKDFPSIGVHWALTEHADHSRKENLDDSIWEDANETTILDTPVLTLCPEDQIIHLLQTMAGHMQSNGFGLRQLCDLVLYIEANKNIINWEAINQYIETYSIRRFALSIFITCKKLFNMEIPHHINYDQALETTPYIESLIDDILNAGVYGRKTEERGYNNKILHYIDETHSNNARKALSFLFPIRTKLKSKK